MKGKEENKNEDGARNDASFSDPSKLALEALRLAHANYLHCVYKKYGNAVCASSVLHAVHAAMFKYEMDFLKAKQENDSDEKGGKS